MEPGVRPDLLCIPEIGVSVYPNNRGVEVNGMADFSRSFTEAGLSARAASIAQKARRGSTLHNFQRFQRFRRWCRTIPCSPYSALDQVADFLTEVFFRKEPKHIPYWHTGRLLEPSIIVFQIVQLCQITRFCQALLNSCSTSNLLSDPLCSLGSSNLSSNSWHLLSPPLYTSCPSSSFPRGQRSSLRWLRVNDAPIFMPSR